MESVDGAYIRVVVFNSVVREDFTEEYIRLEEDKGFSHRDIWEKSVAGRRKSQCKGPEADM